MAAMIVLVGEFGRHFHDVAALVRAGAVVLIAPNQREARRWLELSEVDPRVAQWHDRIVLTDDLTIDVGGHRAIWRGAVLPISERELQILTALSEHPGRAWSFAELTERIWRTPYYGDSAPVSAAVQRLRHKLAETGVLIESVRGVGFRLGVDG